MKRGDLVKCVDGGAITGEGWPIVGQIYEVAYDPPTPDWVPLRGFSGGRLWNAACFEVQPWLG